MIVFTDARCQQYESLGHPERPFRVQATEAFLKSVMDLNIEWRTPTLATSLSLERAHRSEHLDRVEKAAEAFDGDTPAYEGIWDYSRRATGAALDALEVVLKDKGVNAFSLMRPPGHHATAARAMGFCYLNHVATTALEAASKGLEKVAILDFDVHHGNGTEAILKGNLDFNSAPFISIPAILEQELRMWGTALIIRQLQECPERNIGFNQQSDGKAGSMATESPDTFCRI